MIKSILNIFRWKRPSCATALASPLQEVRTDVEAPESLDEAVELSVKRYMRRAMIAGLRRGSPLSRSVAEPPR